MPRQAGEAAVELARQMTRAAGKAEIHVDLKGVRIACERLQNDRLAYCDARGLDDPRNLVQGDVERLPCRRLIAERSGEPEHAAVGGQQHKVRRIGLQFVAVAGKPWLGLFIFRDGELQEKPEADRGRDQGVGEMRGGARRQDQEAEWNEALLARVPAEAGQRRCQDAADLAA